MRATQTGGAITRPHLEEHGESRASRSTRPGSSRWLLRRLGGGFGLRLALLARYGLFRVLARRALGDAGSVEETHHAVRRLRALGHPRLHLVEVELEAALIVLRQQRIEVAETLDEAAIARIARVGNDDVIDRALLGACAREADND